MSNNNQSDNELDTSLDTVTEVDKTRKKYQDLSFLGISLICILLILSLVSYNPSDDAWSLSTQDNTHNSVGLVGAYLADFLFHLFGYLAYTIPAFGISKIIQLLNRQKRSFDEPWLVRLIGLCLLILPLCALADLSVFNNGSLPAGAGGIIGEQLNQWFLPLFSLTGSAIFWLILLASGSTLFWGVSWLNFLELVGAGVFNIFAFLSNRAPSKRKNTPLLRDSNTTSEPVVKKSAPTLSFPISFGKEKAKPSSSLKSKKKRVKSSQEKSELSSGELKIEPLSKYQSELSKRAAQDSQTSLFIDPHSLPSISLLNPPKRDQKSGYSRERLQEMSELLVQKLADFGVKIEVTAVAPGPVITRFEIQPAPGIKASKISNLARDLARSMAMTSVRVVEVIQGKSVMGIEVPNEDRAVVSLREVLSSQEYERNKSPLTLVLGHDIGGHPVCMDLAKAPHLLVAGTTGSGKSVGVNAMLLSMLFKATPEQLRLILIDPKMLELSVYEGIPHLLTPVITDMKEAHNGLRWSVEEMERRYQLMAAVGVRNLSGYNKKVKDAMEAGEPMLDPLWDITKSLETTPPTLEPLPFIVIVIDEFADMMMMVGKKVEELIARIAQKARAAGIHMVLATQRPSVDVITGLIKANIPTRIAFQVSSKIDSRTILDQGGAEQLLGHGDMLYMPPGNALPERVHGAFVADEEVHGLVAEWKKRGEPDYIEAITQGEQNMDAAFEGGEELDELYDQAVAIVTETGKCSISSVQRRLRIGYNRAARLVEQMEAQGVVSSPAHNGAREVLAPPPPEV